MSTCDSRTRTILLIASLAAWAGACSKVLPFALPGDDAAVAAGPEAGSDDLATTGAVADAGTPAAGDAPVADGAGGPDGEVAGLDAHDLGGADGAAMFESDASWAVDTDPGVPGPDAMFGHPRPADASAPDAAGDGAGGTDGGDASGADATDASGAGSADAGDAAGADTRTGEADAAPATPDVAPPPPSGTAFVYAGGGEAITTYSADLATGVLTYRSLVAAGQNARIAAVDGSGGRAYIHTATSGGSRIFAFQMRPDNGALQLLDDEAIPYYSNGYGGDQLLLSPTRQWILVKGTGSGRYDAAVSPIGLDGRPGTVNSIGVPSVGVTWDATGKCLFGFSTSIDQYSFDAATGTVAASNPPHASISGGRSVTNATIHPNGSWAYGYYRSAAGQLGLFTLDSTRCTMTEQSFNPQPIPAEVVLSSSVTIHPSGRFLYAFGRLSSGTVETDYLTIDLYAIDATTGRLTFVKREKGDDKHRLISYELYTQGMLADLLVVGGAIPPNYPKPGLSVYRVNQSDGTLTSLGNRIAAQAGQSEFRFVFPYQPR
jgi:6-phosphogluconolactonase (cycloisomerase 2 family)